MTSSLMDKTTLVIDDNSIQRQIAMMFPTRFGFKTLGATNEQETVSLYETGERFNLIIMDMEMSIMDGIEVRSLFH